MTSSVKSSDGTVIAFERKGSGPTLLVVVGALSDRSSVTQLAAALAPRFNVLTYDRRGRGESGYTPPYAVEREVEDIDALSGAAGGVAYLYGHSSGGVLALEAAQRLEGFEKLAVYEPPFVVDTATRRPPADYMQHIADLLASGEREEAVEYFLSVAAGVPPGTLVRMKRSLAWSRMVGLAHTLPFEAAVMGSTISGNPLPRGRWGKVTIPTLVMNGEASPDWFAAGALALAKMLPNSRYRSLANQHHGVDPTALAPLLESHFLG